MNQLPWQYVLGLIVLIILVLGHLRPKPLTVPRLLITPIIVLAVGTTGLLAALAGGQPTVRDVMFVIIDLGLSVGLGIGRAVTVRVQGESAPRRYRYTAATLVLCAVSR